MSNSHFTFKQFRIDQDACAMKVSTDACIQGAWTLVDNSAANVLDIGTGTGLLSLMLAQRNECIHIDAIEIDVLAAEQATSNIAESKFAARIDIGQGDVMDYSFSKQYDLIICNPPFFQNSLLGDNPSRNIARHTLTLRYADVISTMKNVLKKDGYLSILLPNSELSNWELLMQEQQVYCTTKLLIHPMMDKPANRVVCICSFLPTDTEEHHLYIKDMQGVYTKEFQDLMAPYYLFL
jgi:tRNA1Val (adenine37-N6)-methyltransferase